MYYRVFILPFSLLVLSDTSFADSTTSKSTYDWTGVYLGGFVGGAAGSNVTSSIARQTDNPFYTPISYANHLRAKVSKYIYESKS